MHRVDRKSLCGENTAAVEYTMRIPVEHNSHEP
jgi:hypothetical protein